MFFSSRRRHTRYWRDWSSSVCSSDLVPPMRRRACEVHRGPREQVGAGEESAMDREQGGLVGLIRRYPISAFFVWFFTVGQAFAFAPLVLDVAVPAQWFINGATVFGLFLPALVITRIVDGRDGLREFVSRIFRVRAPLGLYVAGVVVLPLLVFALGVAILGAP